MFACQSASGEAVALPSSPARPALLQISLVLVEPCMARRLAGRHQILSAKFASASQRGPVPSVTAPGRAGQSNTVNDVGESNFAAIVDRQNRLAGSGDHR